LPAHVLAAESLPTEPLVPAVEAVLGENSIERDRDRYPWRGIHGRLGDVLTGDLDAKFPWPPQTEKDVRALERSMTAGCGPIVETLTVAQSEIFNPHSRWLDIGGGDGTV